MGTMPTVEREMHPAVMTKMMDGAVEKEVKSVSAPAAAKHMRIYNPLI